MLTHFSLSLSLSLSRSTWLNCDGWFEIDSGSAFSRGSGEEQPRRSVSIAVWLFLLGIVAMIMMTIIVTVTCPEWLAGDWLSPVACSFHILLLLPLLLLLLLSTGGLICQTLSLADVFKSNGVSNILQFCFSKEEEEEEEEEEEKEEMKEEKKEKKTTTTTKIYSNKKKINIWLWIFILVSCLSE